MICQTRAFKLYVLVRAVREEQNPLWVGVIREGEDRNMTGRETG